jgi:arylsulfatase A-like enzyme
VLWVLWDTTRADRFSLYGHTRPTTPFLDRWAKQARVFENCLSISNTTVPSHASMFTNLLPPEHGADNTYCLLRDEHETLAEIFRKGGYQTFLYSENPLIASETGFGQGFDRVVNPWSDEYRDRAAEILENKIPRPVRSPELGARLRTPGITHWALSPCGLLGETALTDWLARRDRQRPYFAFLNYMEAHATVITPASYRARMMNQEDVIRSYTMNVTPAAMWQYTFRIADYSADDLRIIGGTYDAALLELDDLFKGIITALQKSGDLENTIIVLASDHGENLGEHHLLGHEFFLYDPVLHIPLVLFYPPAVPSGRETRPVVNMDLFPTLLELANLEAPERPRPASRSLLDPVPRRTRVAYLRTPPEPPFEEARRADPQFDPTPYRRTLLAISEDPHKLIVGTDGGQALYDLREDPAESRDLFPQRPELGQRLMDDLRQFVAGRTAARFPVGAPQLTEAQKEVLRSLGYVGIADAKPAGAPDSGRSPDGETPAIPPER